MRRSPHPVKKETMYTLPLPLIPTSFISLVLGLVLGSFYNVCIFRYLAGTSIVRPGSHCPGCGHVLAWWENIPVLSYLLLGGKCRSCKASISLQYPLVELLSGILALLLALRFGLGATWLVYMILTGLLIVGSFIDLHSFILPDIITLPGAAIALAGSFLFPHGFYSGLLGALAGAGLFLLIQQTYRLLRKIEGLGTGDIKLMLMLGAMTGWQGLPIMIFFAATTGLVVSLAYLKKGQGQGMKTAIPFGPFLSMGTMLYVLWGQNIWNLYLGLLSK
jgi:leader peptidase (prepilin peptidase)/N-methyltransferase